MNECNIVKDLLPLCADDLASPDSLEFIRRHAQNCPECRKAMEQCKTDLPLPDPEDTADKYKKGLRRSKWKLYLKSFAVCLVLLAFFCAFMSYKLYEFGFVPVSQSFPSPDGDIVVEVVEPEDVRPYYNGDGIMVRFRLNGLNGKYGGGINRYSTDWETLSAHWTENSTCVMLDVMTITGEHALFITDATMEYGNGGLWTIPGITEDLVPVFTEALAAELSFKSVEFNFEAWQTDGLTATFRFTTESAEGTISYHYTDRAVTGITLSD